MTFLSIQSHSCRGWYFTCNMLTEKCEKFSDEHDHNVYKHGNKRGNNLIKYGTNYTPPPPPDYGKDAVKAT